MLRAKKRVGFDWEFKAKLKEQHTIHKANI